MGSLAGQFLFESLLAPFAVAGLTLTVSRRFGKGTLVADAPLLALMLAIGTAYVLAFGWPSNPGLGARTKIMLSAIAGAIMGFALMRRPPWRMAALAVGAITIAVWIGFPAIRLGRPSGALLLLPLALALSALWLSNRENASEDMPAVPIMLALALGLAAIATFAKTISLAQIGLALASALFAILIVGRRTPALPALLLSAALLLGLATALLLYGEASAFAVAVLGGTLAAGRLARLRGGPEPHPASIPRHVVFCLLPAAAAILIARIDAGPFSLY